MSKDGHLQVPEIGGVSRDGSHRRSLQPAGAAEAPILRHTQSQNYGAKKKKVKVPPPPIPEAPKLEVVNEQVSKKTRHSKGSRRTSQTSSRLGVDNVAFEMEDGVLRISRGNSAASSVRSSTRDPSVQSLTVVREQYCCFARRTPCERALFAAVCVLSFIVLILIVVVVLIAVQSDDDDGDDGTKSANSILSVFDLTKV